MDTPHHFYAAGQCSDTRTSVVNRIYSCLENLDDHREGHAVEIERSCYNYTIELSNRDNIRKLWSEVEFRRVYERVSYRIISYLDPTINCQAAQLINKIYMKEIPIDKIAQCSDRELAPHMFTEIDKQIALRKEQKLGGKTSFMYTCPKCRKNETITQLVQLRALDEGANTSAICTNCGHQWIAA